MSYKVLLENKVIDRNILKSGIHVTLSYAVRLRIDMFFYVKGRYVIVLGYCLYATEGCVHVFS